MKRSLMIAVMSALLSSCNDGRFAWWPCSDSPEQTKCFDGSIYIGSGTDTNSNLFMMPCDLGRHLENDQCIGDAKTYAWGSLGAATGFMADSAGRQNTKDLVQPVNSQTDAHETVEPFAAQACAQQTFGGHKDWHLPSPEESGALAGIYM